MNKSAKASWSLLGGAVELVVSSMLAGVILVIGFDAGIKHLLNAMGAEVSSIGYWTATWTMFLVLFFHNLFGSSTKIIPVEVKDERPGNSE